MKTLHQYIGLLSACAMIFVAAESHSQGCDLDAAATRRTQVTDMKFPYAAVVQMTMKRGKSYNGTSFFIHPRVLLTAGHNLRKRPQFYFKRVKRLTLRIGATDAGTHLYQTLLETTQDVNIFTDHNFNRHYTIGKDFGLIILPDTIACAKAGGHFKLSVFDSTKIKGKQIHIAGYPGDKPFCTQWTDATQNFFPWKNYMHYDFATEHGASGAPIWYSEAGQYYVFGIHTNGDHFDEHRCNTATLISPEVYDQIKTICLSQGIDITR